MTESTAALAAITTDAASKLAAIATDAASKPAAPSKAAPSTPPKTPDKPEAAIKNEPDSKTSSELEPPTTTPGIIFPASSGSSLLGHLGTKRQTKMIASAVFCLVAVIAALRLMWPSSDDSKTQTPTQQLAGDPKSAATSPENTPAPTSPTIPPPSLTTSPDGISIPTLPLTGSTVQTGSTLPNVLPVSPVASPLSPVVPLPPAKPNERFIITDKTLGEFQKDNLPDGAMIKLKTLKNTPFSRDQLVKEIDWVLAGLPLTAEAKGKYQEYILAWAKLPDPAPSASNPLPLNGSQPGTGQTSPVPVNVNSVTALPASPLANAAKPIERYKITDQALAELRRVQVPDSILTSLSYYLKDKELSLEDMTKEITAVLAGASYSAQDKAKYQSYVLYYAKFEKAASSNPVGAGSALTPPPASPPVPGLTPTNPPAVLPVIPNLAPSVVPLAPVPGTPTIPIPTVTTQPGSGPVVPPSPALIPVPTPTPNLPIPIVSPGVPAVPAPDLFGPSGSRSPSNQKQPPPAPELTGFPMTIPSPFPGASTSGQQIITTGGFQAPQNPAAPMVPTAPIAGGPPAPTVPSPSPSMPTAGGPAAPMNPTVPLPSPMVPGTPSVVPSVPSPSGPSVVPSVPLPGPQSPVPGVSLPSPPVDLFPKLPQPSTGSLVTPPVVVPSPGSVNPLPGNSIPSPGLPAFPSPAAVGVQTAPTVPGVFPSPSPEGGNTTGTNGATPNHTKPPVGPSVTQTTAMERTPTTSYDVDIYSPKQGDTWEAISREFYNDTKYAAALRAVNNNVSLSGGMVDIPPLFILKQKSQTGGGLGGSTALPSPPPSPPPASAPQGSAPTWAPSNPTTPATPSAGTKIYRVPAGGDTLPAIAKKYLGNEQRWTELYNLNPHVTAPNAVPAGTEIKLPADAKVPN